MLIQSEIRKPSVSDYGSILSILDDFFEESVGFFNLEPDKDTLLGACKYIINNHLAIVAVEDKEVVGIIAGTLAPSDFNVNIKIATELVWYVKRSHRDSLVGVKILTAFERRAIELGATHIAMAYMENLNPEKLKLFYERRGYKPMQTQYVRSLK